MKQEQAVKVITVEARMLSVADAARYCAVSTDTIRRAIKEGEFRHVYKKGEKLLRLDKADVDKWLDNQRVY